MAENKYAGVESFFDNTQGCNVYRFEQVVNCTTRSTASEPVAVSVSTENIAINETEDDSEEEIESDLGDGQVSVTWRLISAVQAWPCSDFPYPQLVDYSYNDAQALRGVADLVNTSKPDLTWNHSNNAHDVAGYIDNAQWEDSSDIPIGVNAQAIVDPEYDKKAALGLSKGFIRSGSIGVVMDCKPSHESMKFSDFVSMQGEEIDGVVVRWLPLAVHGVRHMAMLAAGTGADPNAGRRITKNMKEDRQVEAVASEEAIVTENSVTEESSTTTTTTTDSNNETGATNMTDYVLMLSKLAESLGVEVALSEDGNIPDGLEERLQTKIGKLVGLTERYNQTCAKLEAIEDVIAAPSKDESIDYLKSKLALSKHGEKLLEHYRKEAIRWFDSAKVAIGKADLSESDKRMRNRISKSEDLDMLEDWITEYRDVAESSLSSKRVSEGIDLPKENRVEISQRDKDIEASVAALFKDNRRY